jgi:alkyl hydroperoxide reductase subunit F
MAEVAGAAELLRRRRRAVRLITLIEHRDDNERKPSFSVPARRRRRRALRRPADGPRIHLAGPGPAAGRRHPPKVEADVIEQIRNSTAS